MTLTSEKTAKTDTDTAMQWYVMRAYKCEGKAEEALKSHAGIEHFIPKHYVVRIYHGVKSKRLVPVIPSLIFVHASKDDILEFKKRHNFLQFVMWKATPPQYLVVPDKQMEDFIKVATSNEDTLAFFKPEEIDIKKGARVRIHGGQFDGVTGTFMQVKGKRNRRVVVMLEGIMAVAAEVHPDLVEVIK